MFFYRIRSNDKAAFFSSSAFILGMGASTAFALYPNLLPASTNPAYNLTIYNTAAAEYGLWVGLVWWIIGIVLAGVYFTYLHPRQSVFDVGRGDVAVDLLGRPIGREGLIVIL